MGQEEGSPGGLERVALTIPVPRRDERLLPSSVSPEGNVILHAPYGGTTEALIIDRIGSLFQS